MTVSVEDPLRQCTRCGEFVRRSELTVKRAQFQKMGSGASSFKSRVMAWLCPPCLLDDREYNLPERSTPQFTSRGGLKNVI
jgi:hypothetical protein